LWQRTRNHVPGRKCRLLDLRKTRDDSRLNRWARKTHGKEEEEKRENTKE
jgi:hypothetical protein